MANDEFGTPDWVFRGLDYEFHFDVDVAASAENAKCERYITAREDALCMSWGNPGEWAFCNPPYSQPNVPLFVKRAVNQSKKGIGSVLVLQLDVTEIWAESIDGVASEVRLLSPGRLKFVGASNSAKFGTVFVIYRPLHVGSTHYRLFPKQALKAYSEQK